MIQSTEVRRFALGLELNAPGIRLNEIGRVWLNSSGNGKEYDEITSLPGLVKWIVFWDDDLILLWVKEGENARNIARYDLKGQQIWLVEAPPAGENGYESIRVSENAMGLVAETTERQILGIDPDTGRIRESI